jgi:hypothetical protein
LKNGENSLKRRELLILSGAIGLGSGIATHQIFAQSQQIETENCLEIEAIADTPLLRFASVGDVGTGSKEQYAIAEAIYCYAQKNPFPFILLTGDNIYQFGEIERVKEVFERPYAKILAQNIRFRAVLGNHDIDNKRNGGGGAGLYGVSRSEWTAYSESRHCFAIFDVSDDRLDIRGIGTDGKVFDRGTISLV